MRNLAVALALAISSSGCVILFNMPVNRFVSPESQSGFGHGHVDLGVGASDQVTLSPNSTTTFANTVSPALGRANTQARVGAEFGVIDRLDVGLRTSFASNEPAFIEGKYQFIGPSRQQSKEGDFSFAGTLAYGGNSGTTTTDGSATHRIRMNALDGALIAGYRTSDSVLLYGGYSYTGYHYSGEQTLSNSATQSFSGDAHHSGLNVGAELGSGAFRVKIEVAESWATAGTTSTARPYLGMQGSLYF